MSHPLIWPSKYFFYPIGNTSAVSVTMDIPPEEPARVLLLGCGDPRNVLYTVYTEKPNSDRALDFTCCDIDPAILARNVLLFTLIADGHPEAAIWDIFFHFRLNATSRTLLIGQCEKLVNFSQTARQWRDSPYGRAVKMCTDYTLAEIRRHWELYVAIPNLPATRLKELDDLFKAEWKKLQNMPGRSSTATRSLGPLILLGSGVVFDSLRMYWKTGTLFTDDRSIADATLLNPIFVYSIAGEGCAVHYGTDPLVPFHLAPVIGNAKGSPTLPDVIKAAKAQFSQWCASYRAAVSAESLPPPVVRCFLGEATAVCHSIRVFANSGHLNPGIPVAQWKTQLIQLNDWEYVSAPTGLAPTQFNVIHTSNLEDHIGLLNVLIPAVPLISPGASSVLYTESLLFLGDDATKEFVEHLHADITVMGLLFGICPVDYLCGFTSRSNTHELYLQKAAKPKSSKKKAPSPQDFGIGQFQQLVTWKAPSSGDPLATQAHVPPPSFDPQQMATFFYDVYQSLYGQESAMNFWSQNSKNPLKAMAASNLVAHYTREAFVLFIKLVKDRLLPSDEEWAETVGNFDTRLLATWSKANMETLHYQDLCGQLHRYGLYRARSFRPPARKIGPFAPWKTVPDLIRIVLVVPRHELAVMENLKAEEVGTPPLHCDIHGSRCLNLFASAHAAFGRAISVGTKAEPQVIFEEDVQGWKGKSSLVLSFTAPSYLITELEDPESLSVGFCVRNTPQACATLIGKLGMELRIFRAKLMDSSLVHILPEPSLPARRRKAPAPPSPLSDSLSVLKTQIGETNPRAVLEFDKDCECVETLAIRVDVTDEKAVEIFSSEGSKVVPEIEQLSACVVRIVLEERVQDLAFPFPVMGSQHRLRLARKSRYIEVLVPTSRSFMADGMKLNPYPVIRPRGDPPTLFPWSIHRVNPLVMPTVDLKTKNLHTWLSPHIGSMMSSRERSLRRKHKHDALMYVKDTILTILLTAAGVAQASEAGGSSGRGSSRSSGPKTMPTKRLFCLNDEKTNNSDTILFVNDLRYDLASHTVIGDAYVLPLTKAFILSHERDFGKLISEGGLCTVAVFEGEMQGWKQLLPSFVERCRTTWTHTANCEYNAGSGTIPLTEDMEASPICTCGQGKGVEGMLKVALWKPFAAYVTRVAISPLFAVSYLEKVGRSEGGKCSVCREKGKPSLKACSGCKKVRYCSGECQKKDWKEHKLKCKA